MATTNLLYLIVLWFGVVSLGMASDGGTEEPSHHNARIPSSCSMVMAPSSIPNGGWGVFAWTDRPRGQEALKGDVVIQVADLNTTFGVHAKRLVQDYGWNAAETGGQYEGIVVMSVSPGIGMLANGAPHAFNVLPKLEPTVDEAQVTRHASPGAGAFSHYHNFSFFLQHDLKAGDEIMVNYGPNWFQIRENKLQDDAAPKRRSKESLLQEGFCLDNLQAGQSSIPHAGRGAFATRALPKGSIVAPVPVLPLTKREVMDATRMRQVAPDQSVASTTKQLWLNYCYGHPKSSVLLFPYSPIVNLINHAAPPSAQANVKLQWSNVNTQHSTLSLEDLQKTNTHKETTPPTSLLLELVALRDIAEGEEVLLDYGSAWQDAWNQHVDQWQAYPKSYAPAHVMEQAVPVLATQEELQSTQSSTYPPNLITSCFYPYLHNPNNNNNSPQTNNDITKAQWKPVPGIWELRHLRPCTVMQRFEVPHATASDKEQEEPTYYYTVVIRNRYGLSAQERIPAGHMHVVTHVPRNAIRFTDKIYTTDQHLTNAFRHEIGLVPDTVFPSQWMDL